MQLHATPLAPDAIPRVESSAWAAFLAECVAEAFAHARDAMRTAQKNVREPDTVAYGKSPSRDRGRLQSAHWHTRASRHRVPFDRFVQGILVDHTPNEQQYIESLEKVTCLKAYQPNVGIWHNCYRLPPLTANRDFVELVFCIPLPPHAEPFSEAHEACALRLAPWLPHATVPQPAPGERRAFLVLSQPVQHIPAHGYTRAYYASVEAVCELPEQGTTEWLMTVQTDSAGWVPLWIQERMMPSKIAEDVPSFLAWLHR